MIYLMIPLMLVLGSGCTSQMARAQAAAEASKAGCLCVARKCSTVLSASGQAALSAEASAQVRQITIEAQGQ